MKVPAIISWWGLQPPGPEPSWAGGEPGVALSPRGRLVAPQRCVRGSAQARGRPALRAGDGRGPWKGTALTAPALGRSLAARALPGQRGPRSAAPPPSAQHRGGSRGGGRAHPGGAGLFQGALPSPRAGRRCPGHCVRLTERPCPGRCSLHRGPSWEQARDRFQAATSPQPCPKWGLSGVLPGLPLGWARWGPGRGLSLCPGGGR